MRIALLCATRRGLRLLERLFRLARGCELVVGSFREEPGEPPFIDAIRECAERNRGRFVEVRQVAGERGRPIWEPAPDLMLVASWRYLIPREVYQRPGRGTFVFHDSLLPGYRGFAPTVWAIRNGEDHTGATLFEIADDVDSGDIIDQRRVPIGLEETVAEVMERVTEAYLEILEANLDRLMTGTAPRRRQDHREATYTCKRIAEDNRIDWNAGTADIYNLIRAVTRPYAGAYTLLEGRRLRVWNAKRVTHSRRYVGRVPGRVVEIERERGAVVLTGDGALLLTEVQVEDRPSVVAAEVLNRMTLTLGR